MTDSITPPRELMEQWASEKCYDERDWLYEFNIATRAAQWGADRELEACCEWLHWQNLATHPELIPSLRAARRPKPSSLKEQALAELAESYVGEFRWQGEPQNSPVEMWDGKQWMLASASQGPTDEELVELFNENDWNFISPETFIDIARSVLELR